MMLAWRSLLGRSHPLLLSSLRPGRHASHITAAWGNINLIGSRGYASNSNGDYHTQVNRQHPPVAHETTKRHLYVVLDDNQDSYGIHKLDIGDRSDDPDGGYAHGSSLRRLPVLPVLSVAVETLGELAQFAAVGSIIVATGSVRENCADSGRVLIYDTKTDAMVVSPHLPGNLDCGHEAALAVGQRLYIIQSMSSMFWGIRAGRSGYEDQYMGGLHCLAADPDVGGGNELWRWRPLSASPPWCWSGNDDYCYHIVPLKACGIYAHAVDAPSGSLHQDIYVSTFLPSEESKMVTFGFSTASGKWTQRGDWPLPVVGAAHYDSVLGAWLGLHAGQNPDVRDGHLCAGNVTSTPLEWKISREKLFRLDEDTAAGWRHFDAKLVPMAPREGGNEYCLVERMHTEGETNIELLGDCDKWLLRLIAFRVEHGQDGEPVVTARRPARCYRMSRYNMYFEAQAFWM